VEKIWFEIWAHTKHPHHPNPTHQPRTKRQANTPPSKVPCFFKNNVYLSVCEGTILTRERQKKDVAEGRRTDKIKIRLLGFTTLDR